MMRKKRTSSNLPYFLLLFTGLGVFSYWWVQNFTTLPTNENVAWKPYAILFTSIIFFNAVGLHFLQVNRLINKQSPFFFSQKNRMIYFYIVVACILLLLNYLLLIAVRYVSGLPSPYLVEGVGWRMLIILWLVELVIMGLVLTNSATRYTLSLYRKNTELEESSIQARYRALQNQLNPHFLFNSLSVLIAEIEDNPQNAVAFTRELSDVYRYILQTGDKTTVTLEEELTFVASYLFLQRVRIGAYITFDNLVDKSDWDQHLPPLTLQVLLENAIKHNVISEKKPMRIELLIDKTQGIFIVRNELTPKKGSFGHGVGLKNLQERYHLLESFGMDYTKTDKHFIVKLPLLYGETTRSDN